MIAAARTVQSHNNRTHLDVGDEADAKGSRGRVILKLRQTLPHPGFDVTAQRSVRERGRSVNLLRKTQQKNVITIAGQAGKDAIEIGLLRPASRGYNSTIRVLADMS